MRRYEISTLSLISLSLFIIIIQPVRSQNIENFGDLTIIISGLKNDKGDIKIGLFNSEESWKDKKEKFRGAVLKIKNNKAEWLISKVPFGDYAIKFFHDENGDDKINTNIFGFPKETYGFYKPGKIKYIPPGFEKTKFKFNSISVKIEIVVN